jgi:hypothetical protein
MSHIVAIVLVREMAESGITRLDVLNILWNKMKQNQKKLY